MKTKNSRARKMTCNSVRFISIFILGFVIGTNLDLSNLFDASSFDCATPIPKPKDVYSTKHYLLQNKKGEYIVGAHADPHNYYLSSSVIALDGWTFSDSPSWGYSRFPDSCSAKKALFNQLAKEANNQFQ